MNISVQDYFTSYQLSTINSIIHVGLDAYRELVESHPERFEHKYFSRTRNSIKTKFVQMQCEIESHDPKFPFVFTQREFPFGQVIPELHTDNVILHFARMITPDSLPYAARYRVSLSGNNKPIQRQLILDTNNLTEYKLEPFYGIIVFDDKDSSSSIIQFPEPGYTSIADSVIIPQITIASSDENSMNFERKKAVLKNKFLTSKVDEEGIS